MGFGRHSPFHLQRVTHLPPLQGGSLSGNPWAAFLADILWSSDLSFSAAALPLWLSGESVTASRQASRARSRSPWASKSSQRLKLALALPQPGSIATSSAAPTTSRARLARTGAPRQ